MKRIRLSLLCFLVVTLFAASACSCGSGSVEPSPYDFDYPADVTPKYCLENYRVFDPNIRYTECYEFVTTKNNRETISGLVSIEFSAIKDADDLSFMVCYKTNRWFFGDNRQLYVVRRENCGVQPITDYTLAQIELCTYRDLIGRNSDLIDEKENPESYYRYAENTFSDSILTVNSPEATAEILAVAQRTPTMTTEKNLREQEEFPSSSDLEEVLWQEEPLYIKISFEECAGLVWVGQLLTDDEGRAYMERSVYVHGEELGEKEAELSIDTSAASPTQKSRGYPLGEYMDAILVELQAKN